MRTAASARAPVIRCSSVNPSVARSTTATRPLLIHWPAGERRVSLPALELPPRSRSIETFDQSLLH